MTSELKHCQATPTWTISVPVDFAEIHNGDSWQAHAGSRVVYVSSMKVTNGETPVPAAALLATAARKLAPASDAERHRRDEADVQGDAQVISMAAGLELKGFACADGSVATCLIHFDQLDDREWAVTTWRSLRPVASPAERRPWWRFW
jgi:hypothetical protein